jgi:hypothetical protein
MSELDDLESYAAPETTDQLRQAACRNRDRNARERAAMRRRNRAMVSDREADLIYARVLAEIRSKP